LNPQGLSRPVMGLLYLYLYPINDTKIFEKKKVTEHKMCFDFLYKFCLKHFSFEEEMSEILLKVYIDLDVKLPLFFSDFNET
jgi:hypothetical protein